MEEEDGRGRGEGRRGTIVERKQNAQTSSGRRKGGTVVILQRSTELEQRPGRSTVRGHTGHFQTISTFTSAVMEKSK